MKGGLVIVAIVAVLVLVVGGWVAGNYNTLVSKSTEVDKSFAEVDNLLQRRNDLIPNLVETVKGVAAQEQTVFGEIASARAAMAGAEVRRRAADGHGSRAAAGRDRELPAAQVAGELPAPPGRARRHREPVVGRPHALQRGRARLQRAGQELPDEHLRGDVRLQ